MFEVTTAASNEHIEGKWFEVPGFHDLPEKDRPAVLVARAENDRYMACVDRLKKPHRKQIDKKTVSTKIITDITYKAMASTIFLGFRNFVGRDKQPVEDTENMRYKILKYNADLRGNISEFSWDFDEEESMGVDQQAGKSPVTSTGGTDTPESSTSSSPS